MNLSLSTKAWVTVADLLSRVMVLASVTVAARSLGPGDFGGYTMVLAYGGLASILLELASPLYFLRDAVQKSGQDINRLFAIYIGFRTIIAMGAGILLLCLLLYSSVTVLLTVATAIWLFSLACNPEWRLQADQRLVALGWYRVSVAVAGFGGTFIAAQLAWSVGPMLLCRTLLECSVAMAVVLWLRPQLSSPPGLSWKDEAGRHLGGSGWFFVSALATGIYASNLDLIVLAETGAGAEAGVYAVAQKIYLAGVVPIKISLLVAQRSLFSAGRQIGDVYPILRNAVSETAGVGAVLSVMLTAGGLLLVRLIFGSGYEAAGDLLIPLGLSALLVGIAAPLPVMLISLNRTKVASLCYGLASLVSIVLNLLLTPRWGVCGAIVAVIAAELTLLVASGLAVRSILMNTNQPVPHLPIVVWVAAAVHFAIVGAYLLNLDHALVRYGIGTVGLLATTGIVAGPLWGRVRGLRSSALVAGLLIAVSLTFAPKVHSQENRVGPIRPEWLARSDSPFCRFDGSAWVKSSFALVPGAPLHQVEYGQMTEDHRQTWSFVSDSPGLYEVYLEHSGLNEGLHLPFLISSVSSQYGGVLTGRRSAERAARPGAPAWRHLGNFTFGAGENVEVTLNVPQELRSRPDGTRAEFWGIAAGVSAIRVRYAGRAMTREVTTETGAKIALTPLVEEFRDRVGADLIPGQPIDLHLRLRHDAPSIGGQLEIELESDEGGGSPRTIEIDALRNVWIYIGTFRPEQQAFLKTRVRAPLGFELRLTDRHVPLPPHAGWTPSGVGLNVRDLLFPEGPADYGCDTMRGIFERYANTGFTLRFWLQDITERLWTWQDVSVLPRGQNLPYNPLYLEKLQEASYYAEAFQVALVPVLWDDYFADPYLWARDPYNRANGGPFIDRLRLNRHSGGQEPVAKEQELFALLVAQLRLVRNLTIFDLGNDFSGDQAWLRWGSTYLRERLSGLKVTWQYSTGIYPDQETAALADYVCVRAYPYEHGNDALGIASILVDDHGKQGIEQGKAYVGEFGPLIGFENKDPFHEITRIGLWASICSGTRAVWKWSSGYGEGPAPTLREDQVMLAASRALADVSYLRRSWAAVTDFKPLFGSALLAAARSGVDAHVLLCLAMRSGAGTEFSKLSDKIDSLRSHFQIRMYDESVGAFQQWSGRLPASGEHVEYVVLYLTPVSPLGAAHHEP